MSKSKVLFVYDINEIPKVINFQSTLKHVKK